MERKSFTCRLAGPVLCTVILLMASCTDDMDQPRLSDRILFTSEIQNAWSSSAASGAAKSRSSVSVMQAEGIFPLYLHTLCADSIKMVSLSDTLPATRFTPVNQNNMYDTFGVFAYAYTTSWDSSQSPNYMYDVSVSRTGKSWMPSSAHYWPGSAYKMKFFAYAPKGVAAYQLSEQDAGVPAITCMVPESVADQQDLLVAASDEVSGNSGSAVNLTFRHALTAVRFVCGRDMKAGTVKSVALKGVNSTGTYSLGSDSWSRIGSPKDFVQTLNKTADGTDSQEITVGAQTFMMIPQTLPDDAFIEVVFNDGKADHTLTSSLKGTSWPMGKTITYKISTTSINWEYTLSVLPPGTYSFKGGSSAYSITSYRENSVTKEPVSWQAEFSTDRGKTWKPTKPDWLSAFSSGNTGEGSLTAVAYTATVAPQTGSSESSHTDELRRRPSKGSKGMPYNLSNDRGEAAIQNTANCYVVSAPGDYCFPLVYGNAIKGGADNRSAYFYDFDAEFVLKNFINHLGAPVRFPKIYENAGCEARSCKLLWQDAPGLVSDVALYDNGHSVRFTVGKATIQQGNAVVAVFDAGGNIMWSWHIWVTDTDVQATKKVVNADGIPCQMMAVNLGWCDGEHVTFARRECRVRIKADEEVRTFVIVQDPFELDYGGNSPYFQWGRKDPLYPGDIGTLETKYWYDGNGRISNDNPLTSVSQDGKDCIVWGILNPQKLNRNQGMDNTYVNLWDTESNVPYMDGETPTKSIYDPCPVGFRLPRGMEFTGFSKTGNTAEEEDMNVSGSYAKGWNFYTGPDGTGETIFFPATGSRYGSENPGKLNRIGLDILVYVAASFGISNGYYLWATNVGIWLNTYTSRQGAFSIRPVHD